MEVDEYILELTGLTLAGLPFQNTKGKGRG